MRQQHEGFRQQNLEEIQRNILDSILDQQKHGPVLHQLRVSDPRDHMIRQNQARTSRLREKYGTRLRVKKLREKYDRYDYRDQINERFWTERRYFRNWHWAERKAQQERDAIEEQRWLQEVLADPHTRETYERLYVGQTMCKCGLVGGGCYRITKR